jgi:hypothetical protein
MVTNALPGKRALFAAQRPATSVAAPEQAMGVRLPKQPMPAIADCGGSLRVFVASSLFVIKNSSIGPLRPSKYALRSALELPSSHHDIRS